jgi:hypothetical protein
MIARLTRPLGPILKGIEDRERTSGGMEELGCTVCRQSYPSFWFFLLSEWRPEYYPMIVSGSSECVNIWFCIYLLGIYRVPESTEPSIHTHELMLLSWDVHYISPGEFLHISIEYLTPSAVIGKIQRDVLAK